MMEAIGLSHRGFILLKYFFPLLLKTLHTMVLRYKDISLELNWNFPWYVALKVLESAMKVWGEGKA